MPQKLFLLENNVSKESDRDDLVYDLFLNIFKAQGAQIDIHDLGRAFFE